MLHLLEAGILMRIVESGEFGDEDIKVNVAASGKGRLNVTILVVLVRFIVTGARRGGKKRLRSGNG